MADISRAISPRYAKMLYSLFYRNYHQLWRSPRLNEHLLLDDAILLRSIATRLTLPSEWRSRKSRQRSQWKRHAPILHDRARVIPIAQNIAERYREIVSREIVPSRTFNTWPRVLNPAATDNGDSKYQRQDTQIRLISVRGKKLHIVFPFRIKCR